MKKEFRVLMLEDSEADEELIKKELVKTKFTLDIKRVDNKDDFCRSLKEFNPDVILSDYNLPSFDGISALAIAHTELPSASFIFVSGAIGEERAIDALKKGATDYVLKERLSRLVPAFERAINDINHRLDHARVEEELHESELRFKAFMDHNPAVAFLKTTDGRYIYANKPFEQSFNLTQKDWSQKTDFDLWPAEMAKRMHENDQMMLTFNRSVELIENLPGHDGASCSWLVFKFPVDSGERKLIGGLAIDITEQKEMESQLKHAVEEVVRLNEEKGMIRNASSLNVFINETPQNVYRYIVSLQNLPRWATSFCLSIEEVKGEWIMQTPHGPAKIRMVPENPFGILDHQVSFQGKEVVVPMRVVAHGSGSEVVITLFQEEGLAAQQHSKDIEMAENDLKSLKSIMEMGK